jgi:microcompartment protein CcmK/EutM
VLPPVERKIVACRLVGAGAAEARQTAAGTAIRVAAEDRRPVDTVVRLELDGPAGTLEPR